MLLFLMPLQQLCHLDGHGTVHCVPASERLLFRNDGIPTGPVQCNSAGGISRKTHSSGAMGLCLISCTTVLSYTKFMSPPAHRKSRTSAGLMVKEESAASVGTRPWTPEGRSLLCPLPLCFSWV
ncbi:hypothetical protein AVEN_151797-1 [Araneus ventricosus]|uniref:Uncharacterized protein n=1 Tax=Araneus ventricosus TaxID=182803 RepID=A0A4Y2M3L1_ARAVE|nr:hypothetical protein AVEN_151558-1 [Araneus ventricosus]GBN21639.1 hypothetical protein AVEN_151797-1 [Araneus ventricosus]